MADILKTFQWTSVEFGLSWGLFLGACGVVIYLVLSWYPKELYLYERDTNGKTLDCLMELAKEAASASKESLETTKRVESKVDALVMTHGGKA